MRGGSRAAGGPTRSGVAGRAARGAAGVAGAGRAAVTRGARRSWARAAASGSAAAASSPCGTAGARVAAARNRELLEQLQQEVKASEQMLEIVVADVATPEGRETILPLLDQYASFLR